MNARAGAKTGAMLALAGILLSGPIGLWLVSATYPQPSWQDADAFVEAYHGIQTFPYFAGFLMAAGFLVLVASLHLLAAEGLRAHTACALAFTTVFAAMIFANCAIQTTFVPALVRGGSPESSALVAALTMANPNSLGWALEMWGYAALGVATWLCAPAFDGGALDRATQTLFIANGPLSLLAAVATAFSPGWTLSRPGILAFVAWNALIVLMMIFAFVSLRRPAPHA